MNSEDWRPIITYGGEGWSASALAQLETVGAEPCEWRRPLGRPSRQVRVEAVMHAASETAAALTASGRPTLHTLWSGCVDVDAWRATEKEKVERWVRQLPAAAEWMLVLPTPKVADKARTDLKQQERCVTAKDPTLVRRVRLLLLSALNTEEQRLGQDVRRERERRNEPGWSFGEYLALQEKLAALLAALRGVEDEALVQYDELDALFTQFVRNASLTEPPPWLNSFSAPLKEWRGLGFDPEARKDIIDSKASLLQLRSYLFSRQLQLLLRMNQPQQIAERCLPLLHICFNELKILEVEAPEGASAAWAVQVCLQVLHVGKQFPDQVHSLPAAALCDYACQKLAQLGEQLGLMPGGAGPSSAQIDAAVWLGAGLGPDPPFGGDQLKDALGSAEAFQKQYLELAELAMGTYKHLGRSRSARLLGQQLATFHQLRGEPHTSAAYLADALAAVEGWPQLQTHVLSQLAECLTGERLAAARARLAASETLEMDKRKENWQQLLETLKDLDSDGCVVPLEDIFELVSVTPINGDQQGAIIQLKSRLPSSVALSPAFSIQTNPPQIVRKESNPRGRRLKGSFNAFLSSDPVEINPGLNEFTLTAQSQIHTGHLCQLSLILQDKMDFVSAEKKHGTIEVIEVDAKVSVESGQLLARLPQQIQLRFVAGTKDIEEGTEVSIKASRGLNFGDNGRVVELKLPFIEKRQEHAVLLDVLATPASSKSTIVDYQLTVTSDLWAKGQEMCVGFTVPVNASVKLHTAHNLKFLQVVVSSICGRRLMLSEPNLEVSSGTVSLLPIGKGALALDPDRPLSYMWQLEAAGPFRAKFEVGLAVDDASGLYSCEFELAECATSIVMQTKVVAASGAEVCRANALCHLQVQVDATEPSSQPLMFELLADFSMWAVCGRTAGVLSLEQTSHNFVLDVMPLTSGFLPHPTIRLSKYIPAVPGSAHPKLEPFGPGQVYNKSKSLQVHVLPAVQST